jgi:violaxanthin de-epoxidase
LRRARAQIRCGDLYADAVVKDFNTCAVTTKKCVPQRANTGEYPEPPADALVKEFNTADFTGRWYISAGLNKLFDTFDCQARPPVGAGRR